MKLNLANNTNVFLKRSQSTAFLDGVGSILELCPSFKPYVFQNRGIHIESDYKALRNDILAIGRDFYAVLGNQSQENTINK